MGPTPTLTHYQGVQGSIQVPGLLRWGFTQHHVPKATSNTKSITGSLKETGHANFQYSSQL